MADSKVKYPCPVRRLVVAWREGKWSIERESRIEKMTLMRSDDLPAAGKRGIGGFWWEVVDKEGGLIHRRISGANPFTAGHEVISRDGGLMQTGAPGEDVLFDIAFPDLPEVAALHFYSDAVPAPQKVMSRPEGPARRIAEIDLRPTRRGGHGRR